MSQENVKKLQRALDAFNRRDLDTLLELLDPEVTWYPALTTQLGGERTVFRGHQGIREMIREEDDALAEYHVAVSETRDLGDRLLAIGRVRTEGKESEISLDSPWALLVEIKDGKAIRVRTFLDPDEALEAAGLSE
jgi:ketosteroid isomerase-like protein